MVESVSDVLSIFMLLLFVCFGIFVFMKACHANKAGQRKDTTPFFCCDDEDDSKDSTKAD